MQVYTIEEARKNALKFFNGDELASDVWLNKYILKDANGNIVESGPEERYSTIANELARIDKNYTTKDLSYEYEEALLAGEIIPGGSGLYGIGNPYSFVSLGNCFVISGNDEDSIGSIYRVDQESAQIYKRRGGVGNDISYIRPANFAVTNAAGTTSGSISFAGQHSDTVRRIGQNGRRGALMLSQHINHPDILSFIRVKNDKKTLTGANISVRVTDEFMQAVEDDNYYVQRFPVSLSNPPIEELEPNVDYVDDNGNYWRKVKAREIFDEIVRVNWESAEPGMLFWDKIISESPADCYPGYKTESTNPCVAAGTLILVKDEGYVQITSKINEEVEVWNGAEFSKVTPQLTGENQPMMHIKFSDGTDLNCTDAHNFYTFKGFSRSGTVVKKSTSELVVGDKLEKYKFPLNMKYTYTVKNTNDNFKESYTNGFFAGDGFYIKDRNYDGIDLYGVKQELIPYLKTISVYPKNDKLDKTRVTVEKGMSKINVANSYTTIDKALGFLSGLIDSDGSRNSSEGSVSISSCNRQFLLDVKLHILNQLGVNGHVLDEKPAEQKLIKGHKYDCNASYRLTISANAITALQQLGLNTKRVDLSNINVNRDASRFIKVTSIERIEDSRYVYCFKEENRGRGCFNGVVTGQCGELPLSPYDSCRLLSVSLTKYVKDAFTAVARFDIIKFKEKVALAMRMMDNIIDLEIEKINSILNKIKSDPEDDFTKATETRMWEAILANTKRGRRSGVSLIGHGDFIAMMGLKYGSEEANDILEWIHEYFAVNLYATSVDLAKERGAFPAWEEADDSSNPFIKRLTESSPALGERMERFGRRNIAILTIPPSGTLSIILGQSSGIEPAFLLLYKRRTKVNSGENVKVDFVDEMGDSWREYWVAHPPFERWLRTKFPEKFGSAVINFEDPEVQRFAKLSPWYGSLANDIDPIAKVKMQGKLQKWIDHSISVTYNLPPNVTQKVVADLYLSSWREGCKGMTIYREGSRSGVLVGKEENDKKVEEVFEYRDAPKRTRELPCDVYFPTINKERYVVLVGLFQNKPYEVFSFKYENIIPKSMTKGILKKQKSGVYHLLDSKGAVIVEDIRSRFEFPEWDFVTRMISTALRHGASIDFVVEQLKKAPGLIVTDYILVIARQLTKYLKVEKDGTPCPNCGDTLRIEGGCMQCTSCGYGKCG